MALPAALYTLYSLYPYLAHTRSPADHCQQWPLVPTISGQLVSARHAPLMLWKHSSLLAALPAHAAAQESVTSLVATRQQSRAAAIQATTQLFNDMLRSGNAALGAAHLSDGQIAADSAEEASVPASASASASEPSHEPEGQPGAAPAASRAAHLPQRALFDTLVKLQAPLLLGAILPPPPPDVVAVHRRIPRLVRALAELVQSRSRTRTVVFKSQLRWEALSSCENELLLTAIARHIAEHGCECECGGGGSSKCRSSHAWSLLCGVHVQRLALPRWTWSEPCHCLKPQTARGWRHQQVTALCLPVAVG